jgi:glycosyltransferase involved in cell wall biosynthesis
MRILTNMKSFPEKWQSSGGIVASAETACTAWEFVSRAPHFDVILIDCDPWLTLKLCALFIPFWFRRKPVVAVDLVLRPPSTWMSKVSRIFKKLLFLRVDHFIHYFRQLDNYEKYFGIGPDRSSYVPFKSNIKGRFAYSPSCEGEYVLCFGRSERDFDTFIRAVAKLPYPAAIPRPNFSLLRAHGAKFTIPLEQLPSNLQFLEDDGSPENSIRIIRNAKLVVLSMIPDRSCASGISTYLTAMVLGKCVILTEGPGTSDVLGDQALFVPPGDSARLAETIERVWNDRELRERVAMSGNAYAESCGTEDDLRRRELDFLVRRFAAKAS